MARSSSYSESVASIICDRIAEGEPLRQICRDETMPAWRTVYEWMDANPSFAARIAHARDIGADAIAMEALQIADTPLEGVRVKETPTGVERVTEDMLGHRKLQIETRLKLLAKWNPKKYGDRTTIDGGETPIKVETSTSPMEAARKVAFLLALGLNAKDG